MLFDMIEEVKRAMRRGVKIQIVTQKPEPKKSSSLRFIQDLAKNPFFKIRYTRNPPAATVIVYDKKEALIMTCFKTSQSESTALWSDTPTLITLATNYFEVMWNTALEDNSKNTAEAPSSYNQVVS